MKPGTQFELPKGHSASLVVSAEKRFDPLITKQDIRGKLIEQSVTFVLPKLSMRIELTKIGILASSALTLWFVASSADAQHMNEKNTAYSQCVDNVGVEADNCLSAARDKEDAALNKDYRKIITLLEKAAPPRLVERDALKQAERSWIVYRDKFCKAEYALYEGGSGGPIANIACLEALTRRHHEDLLAGFGWLLRK
ncbi:lysozyme inhibitor LprI family protein [Asaia sp. HN010]|uniref:lysozyme inhibitor LprI family protein n=1 Tax=Asaia sp. HN010 TaxID=3081233 RepID=UPI0030175EEE